MEPAGNLKEETHHKQLPLCTTRPPYRQGRKLTAVKAYTIASESQHLFIYNVPSINLRNELKSLCTKYGQVKGIHVAQNYKTEQFTECYHVHFERIQSARIAKRLLDTKSFFGGVLHVCYAPEHETLNETRQKLLQRRKDVEDRLRDRLDLRTGENPVRLEDFASTTKSQLRKRRRTEEIKKPAAWMNPDDPLEPTNKQFKMSVESQKVEYGPSIAEFEEAKNINLPSTSSESVAKLARTDTSSLLIPSQVLKSKKNVINRIVFRKDKS